MAESYRSRIIGRLVPEDVRSEPNWFTNYYLPGLSPLLIYGAFMAGIIIPAYLH